MVVSCFVGPRNTATAIKFMKDVSSRMKENSIQIIVDGFTAYPEAVRVFFILAILQLLINNMEVDALLVRWIGEDSTKAQIRSLFLAIQTPNIFQPVLSKGRI